MKKAGFFLLCLGFLLAGISNSPAQSATEWVNKVIKPEAGPVIRGLDIGMKASQIKQIDTQAAAQEWDKDGCWWVTESRNLDFEIGITLNPQTGKCDGISIIFLTGCNNAASQEIFQKLLTHFQTFASRAEDYSEDGNGLFWVFDFAHSTLDLMYMESGNSQVANVSLNLMPLE